jgi:hypothetical protein
MPVAIAVQNNLQTQLTLCETSDCSRDASFAGRRNAWWRHRDGLVINITYIYVDGTKLNPGEVCCFSHRAVELMSTMVDWRRYV